MRTIVVGPIANNRGLQTVSVWFRFPCTGARKTYYGSVNKNNQPQAPGDYAGVDSAEVTALQNGDFVEQVGFQDVIDPTSPLATIQTRLVNIYANCNTAFKAADDVTFARWASGFDGTTWTMKSA